MDCPVREQILICSITMKLPLDCHSIVVIVKIRDNANNIVPVSNNEGAMAVNQLDSLPR